MSETNMLETIVAQASAPGRGGVGIIRVSGPLAKDIAKAITGADLKPRYAKYTDFKDSDGTILDSGIALFFKNPHSFTGEDVLELQGHGGPVVIDMLLNCILRTKGVRMARPGEFSERAFLNNKMDLTQAEAIADLIEASSEQAAKSALQSLHGEFSNRIKALVEKLIKLRIYVEAAIDFPEEEIDFLSDGIVSGHLNEIIALLTDTKAQASQGAILREGMKVVIAGRPNAGKSSLLNALSGQSSAIVTDIAGTTRDVLKEQIHIDGMPLHIIDTAGLREATDAVEQIGIERAWEAIEQADRILLVLDATTTAETIPENIWPELMDKLPKSVPISIIRNKVDQLSEKNPNFGLIANEPTPILALSARTGEGLDALRQHLKECIGFTGNSEGNFMARRRHLDAIDNAFEHLLIGQEQLESFAAGEILAEELKMAQQYLNEITGEFSSDDLLSRIFTSFCIGK